MARPLNWNREEEKNKQAQVDNSASQKSFNNDPWTARKVFANIYRTGQSDRKKAAKMDSDFSYLITDPSSRFYNKYAAATNQAEYALKQLGFNTKNLNDDWLNANAGWIRSNLEYRSNITSNPSAPTKKSTKNQWIAFELYQWQKAEGQTKQAEEEYDKAIYTAKYWASRKDRNYSDEEIIAKVRENFERDYPTLYKMENSGFDTVELNRGVYFNDDILYGAIWQARNPDQKVDIRMAMAKSYLGEGNVWKQNAETALKLNPASPDFNPYAVGSTNLDEAAAHFDVLSFEPDWTKNNANILVYGTDQEKKWFRDIQEGEENSSAAEKAVGALYDWMNKNLSGYTDFEKAKEKLDRLYKSGKITIRTENGREEIDLSILKKMDKSVGINGELGTTDLIKMTRGVDYKYDNVVRELEEYCKKNAENPVGDGSKYMDTTRRNWYGQESPDVATVVKQYQDDKLRESSGVYEDYGTDAEREYVDTSWSATYDDVKTYNNQTRADASGNDDRTKKIIQSNQINVQRDYAGSVLPNLQVVYDYENQQSTKAYLEQELAKFGNRFEAANVGDIGNHTDTITYDGNEYKVEFIYDDVGGYAVGAVTDLNGNPVDERTAYEIAYDSPDVNNALTQYNDEAWMLKGHKEVNVAPEDKEDYEKYRAYKIQLEDCDRYLHDNEQAYNDGKKGLDEAQKKYNEQYYLMEKYGMDTADLYVEDVVLGYLADFADYDSTVWSSYTPANLYHAAIESGQSKEKVYAAAEKGHQEVLRELENAKAAKQYIEELGANIPKNYIDNLARHIAKLERDVKDYEYFALSKNSDFKELAQKGRQDEFDNRPLPWKVLKVDPEYGWDYDDYYRHMNEDEADMSSLFAAYGLRGVAGPYARDLTEDEKDTYYYLVAKGEKAQAVDYVKSLIDSTYGVAQTRATERYAQELQDTFTTKTFNFKTKEEADKWVEENPDKEYELTNDKNGYHIKSKEVGSDANFIGQNLLAVIASPASSMMSLMYAFYKDVSGNELNPNTAMLRFNNFRQNVRSESAKEIAAIYGEGTTKQKLAQMGYEMISNRLDSLMNSATFGAPMIGGKYGEAAGEFFGATPMGFSAAMDAMMEAKRKGASDTQACLIGGITFLAETVTEAISLDNIKNAKELGKDLSANTIKDFLKKWLTQGGVSELIGESANDIIEGVADTLIMKDMSEHNDRVWQYRMQNYSKEEAEALAFQDEIKGVLRTAVMSYLSPGMDVVQFYASRGAAYTEMVRTRRQQNIEKNGNKSVAEAIRGVKEDRAKAKELKEEADKVKEEWLNDDLANGEGSFNWNATGPMSEAQKVELQLAQDKERIDAEKAERQKTENALAVNFEILKAAEQADTPTQNASIASVLDVEGTDQSSDESKAAATKLDALLDRVFGNRLTERLAPEGAKVDTDTAKRTTPIEFIQNMLMGSSVEKVNMADVMQGIREAALGGEQSAAYRAMQTPEFQNGDPGTQARILANTAYADANNEVLRGVMDKAIYENRVNEAQKTIILGNEEQTNAMVEGLQGEVDDAQTELYVAQGLYEERIDATKGIRDELTAANTEFLANPNDANKKRRSDAINKMSAADAVTKEYQQKLQKAEQRLAKAQAALKQTVEADLAARRQQAMAMVDQIDAQRADIERQRQEAQKASEKEAEEKRNIAKEIAKKAQEIDNFTRLNAEEFVDETFPNISEEDRRRAIGLTMMAQKAMSNNFDSVEARRQFASKFAKRFKLNYKEVPGETINGANARIDPSTRTLLINEKATQWDIMYTVLTHEITHLAEGSDTYTELADMALQIRYGDGVTWADTVAKIKAGDYTSRVAQDYLHMKRTYDNSKATSSNNHTIEQIMQEIVADSVGQVVAGDDAALQRLVTKPNLARRVLESIRSFIRKAKGLEGEPITQAQQVADKLANMLKQQTPKTKPQAKQQDVVNQGTVLPKDSYEIRKSYYSDNPVVRFNSYPDQVYINRLKSLGMVQFKDSHGWGMRISKGNKVTAEQIQTALSTPADATPKLSITNAEGEEVATELPGGTVAIDNEKFSISTYDMDERARVRQSLLEAKNDDGTPRFTEEQVDKYMDDALSVFVRVEMDPHKLYYEANSHHPFLKPNDEYYFTLDASTLCAKRLLYQGTFNAVQHMMPDTAFMPEDLIDLVNIMREMGYETPCGICYVESRRRWLDKYAREWLEGFKGENKPTIDQLTTSDGLEELRRNDYDTYKAFVEAMNKKGSNNPKVVQLRTEYDGDIIKMMSDEDRQKVKDIGGLRIQSFSDFETPHLLDMMQAVMDMASTGLTSQAYTKVPNFAWVFGDTGIKINLSLIGKGTGLDENGKLVFDNVEGMNFDEAMKLRDKYDKNVGTILVGINEAHIIAAMGDSRIDYIIPFHKSGWSQEEIRKVGTLNNYDDFTAFQNERVILGRETVTKEFTPAQRESGEVDEWIRNRQKEGKTNFNVKEKNGVVIATADGYKTQSFDKEAEGKKEALKARYESEGRADEYKKVRKGHPDYVESRVNFAPVGANGYWSFEKSGRENAEAYLEMCKKEGRIPKFWQFLVDNGDGSFSLPQGTDEQSTAIREGYWKTLVDFRMYDKNGKGAEQKAVTPKFNMAEAYRVMNSYELGRQMPDRKDGTKGPFIPMESNNDLPTAMPAAEMFVEHMKQKQARRIEQERIEKERIARGEKVKRISKADRALMEETENLRLLNERLQAAGYEGNLTLGGEENEGGRAAYVIDPNTGEVREGWKVSQKTGESTERYSLPAVEPIMPSNEDWVRDAIQTFPELKAAFPNMYNIQDDRTEEQKKNDTSIAGTVSTYRKIFDKLKSEGFNGTILDASSGMGLGTQAGRNEFGFTVDDIEPFPSPDYHPSEGTDYSKLNKKYDVIISNAVLNVLTQDERDALVTKMGELLNDGGRMFINVRGVGDVANLRKNIDTEWVNANGEPSPENPYTGKKNIQIGENEYYTGKGTYQKGFTPQELSSYILDVLGPGYSVAIDSKHETSGSSSAGIVVTKNAQANNDSYRYSLPDGQQNAINIRDGVDQNGETVDFINLILDDQKHGETRKNNKNLPRHQWIGLAKDGMVYGRVIFDDPYQITRESPEYADAKIAGTNYDIGEGESTWYYPILQMEDFRNDPKTAVPKGFYKRYQMNDTRYSLPSDAPYLSAVDHGDMEAAQRIVDDRAKKMGYVKAAYHGTLSGGFTIFDKAKAHVGGNSGAGFYFSSNPDDSGANYSDAEGADNWFKRQALVDRIYELWQDSGEGTFEYEGYEINEDTDIDAIAKEILTKNPQVYNVYLDPGRAYIRDFNNSTNLIEDAINNFDERLYNPDDYNSEDEYYEAMSMDRDEQIYEAISSAVYNGISDVGEHYEIVSNVDYDNIIGKLYETAVDYENLTWNDLVKVLEDQYIDIVTEDMENSTDGSHEIARAIVEAFGYNSIEDREVSKKFNQLKNMGNAGDTVHYIMFNPEQIKLADPVTYDDNGEVIPPSKRFNSFSPDIRYSLPSDDILQQMIQSYLMSNSTPVNNEAFAEGLEGRNPAMSKAEGPKQRGFGNGMLQSSDEIDQEVKDYIARHNAYFPDTNADQISRAIQWVRSNKRSADSDGFNESFQAVTSPYFNYMSADGQARMAVVAAMAAAKGDSFAEAALIDSFNREGTDLGRAFQARKIWLLMTPEGRKQSLDNMKDRVQKNLEAKGIHKNLTFSHWVYDLAEAATPADIDQLRRIAANEIAGQIPANWKDKLRSLRMLSMLANPRTHIRNLAGNAIFVPIVGIKNKIGALLELGKPQGQKTKTLSLRLNDEVRQFAKEDVKAMKDILTGEAKYNETSLIAQQQKAFKGLMQAVIDWNSNKLESEDWTFLKGHYIRALGGWMQANGYTSEQLKSNNALLEQGRAYAVLEAQKATYRDFNEFAKRLNDFVRNPKTLEGKFGALMVEAVLPFKKTPANILRRGLEYSPVGLIKSLTYDLQALHKYNEAIKNGYETIPEGAITPNQWIDKVASGLTGMGIMIAGALLSSAGIISCSAGADDDPEKLKGGQNYSLKILGTDYTYTIDWAAPACIPLFVGAAVSEEHENLSWNDIANAIAGITEPVFNLSMLDGLSSVFKTSSYGDKTDPLTQVGMKIGTNYISSYYPSVFGAFSRLLADDTRRKSYVPKGQSEGPAGTVNYALQSLKNKTPWSTTSIPMRDVWGEAETSGFAERLIENFISPGYINKIEDDPILNEMSRLHDSHVEGSDGLVPSNPPKSYTKNGNTYVFSDKEWDQYYVTRAQTAHAYLNNLINSNDYKTASDEAKVQMMKEVWSYANKVGLSKVVPDYEVDEVTVGSIAHDGKVNNYKASMMDCIASEDWEGFDTMVEALLRQDVEESQIRQWIGNKYRDPYKKAYRNKNYSEMARIEALLDNTGYDFDILKWEEDVDKKYN